MPLLYWELAAGAAELAFYPKSRRIRSRSRSRCPEPDPFSLPSEIKTELYNPINGTELGYVSIPGEKDYLSFHALTANAESELERAATIV
jgi:hypothetical protein